MISPKNKLRLCLISVVFLAVFAGVLYYWYEISNVNDMSQGTLITIVTLE